MPLPDSDDLRISKDKKSLIVKKDGWTWTYTPTMAPKVINRRRHSRGCTLWRMHTRNLLLCATALLLAACSTRTTEPASASITGTASYRERMMLPPGASLEVTLEDVSTPMRQPTSSGVPRSMP
jgi:hypothetical protein